MMNALVKQTLMPACLIAALPLLATADPGEATFEVEVVEAPDDVNVIVEGAFAAAGETRVVPFVGVGTESISDALAAQLGLDEGLGLLVELVAEESPAAEAGIEKNDVLVKFNDQLLVNVEQFTTLIRMQEPGDTVTLTLMRQAKEQSIEVELGEQEIREGMRLRVIDGLDGARFFPGDARAAELAELRAVLRDAQGSAEDARRAVAQLRWEAAEAADGRFRLREFPGLPGLPGDVPLPVDGTVVISDSGADGSAATLRRGEDGLHFELKQDGETVFDGPVDTDEQREAMEPEHRERLLYLLEMMPVFEEAEAPEA